MAQPNLVDVTKYGLKGQNFYFARRKDYNLSLAELKRVGVVDDHPYLDHDLIEPLKKTNQKFATSGYELFIKDAYRAPELYQLVRDKRYAMHGKASTDATFNAQRMIHASGRAVDLALFDIKTGQEVMMRRHEDGIDAFFVDYYKDRSDKDSQEYQRLQLYLKDVMTSLGFELGGLKEYWHFELPKKDNE